MRAQSARGGLGGDFFTISDGKLDGKQIRFRTSVTTVSGTTYSAWTGEMVDDNTIRLGRHLELVGTNALDLLPGLRDRQVVPVSTRAPAVAPVLGVLSGTVADATNALIPGVTVTATNSAGGATTVQTDESGIYNFVSLPSGTYTLSASLSGFQTATAPTINVGSDAQRFNLTMKINPSPADPQVVLHRAK